MIREIDMRDPDHRPRGTTFDGRDRFTPAAAALARGAALEELGPEVFDALPLPSWEPQEGPGGWSVEVIREDRYGNLVTTAEQGFLEERLGEDWRELKVRAGSTDLDGIKTAYADVPDGDALLTIGGSGTLEISVRGGSAAERTGVRSGDRVFLAAPDTGVS